MNNKDIINMLYTIDNKLLLLSNRLNILEDNIDNIINIDINKLKKLQTKEMHIEYGKLISALRKEFKQYDVRKQLDIRKILYNQLPDYDMKLDTYILKVKSFLKEKNIQFNLAEYEIKLHNIGLVKNNCINKHNISEEALRALVNS